MDTSKYIGLPYQQNGRTWQGVDCWGLARLIYKHELNIELPSYEDLYVGSWDQQVSKLIEYHREGWQQVQVPELYDLCVFNIYGEPAHVGVYVGNGSFIHSRDGSDVAIEKINSPLWKKRLDGYFRYKPEDGIQVLGAPHPLKLMKAVEWTAAGTTVQNLADFISTKYQLSNRISNRLVIVVDGIPIPQKLWTTTVLQEGQSITYRSIAEGRQGLRLALTLAIVVVAAKFGLAGAVGSALTGAAATSTTALAVGTLVINTAGQFLLNAIVPIRPPKMGSDPGQPNQLNLFNGSSNQANRLGAIPVVLGKVRYTGLLGATPYIETLTDTNILNLLIIWGFGPLQVSDICVGTNNLEKFYFEDLPVDITRPITLYGSYSETAAEVARFNELYPTDVEQRFAEAGELTNTTTPPSNPWRTVVLAQQATGIDVAFNFPEGMRKIQRSGVGAGDIEPATCSIEIQVALASANFEDTPSLRPAAGNTGIPAYSKTLVGPSIASAYDGNAYYSATNLYQWYTICIGPDGTITEFAGTPTDNINSEPSQAVLDSINQTSYGTLAGVANPQTRLPQVPPGYKRLYTVCLQGGTGLLPLQTINHLTGVTYTGLQLTYTNEQVYAYDQGYVASGNSTINISGGTYIVGTSPTSGEAIIENIFTTSTVTVPGTIKPSTVSTWSDFLNTNAIWPSGNPTTALLTKSVVFPYTGYYNFEASVDDSLTIKLNNATPETTVLVLPGNSSTATASSNQYIQAGTYTVTLDAKSNNTTKGVALKITYSSNSGENIPTGPKTIITFGTPQNFYKRKDPFNWVYRLRGLPRGVYKVRVRRADTEIPDDDNSPFKVYSKCALYNVTSYDNALPTQNPPRSKLAKTAIKVQSNSKANGEVDGLNALVQTQYYDWDRATSDWVFRATNNPASLFLYVLTHPANAYRLANVYNPTNPAAEMTALLEKIDLPKIIEWHNFCNPVTPTANNPKLTFNSVITSTTSVLDILRDICAAGKASPIYVDGKWSVIIDKQRDHVVQHFTPHNSWSFESTKALPKLPHAFRVTIQDEEDAYQTKELYIYNYGYSQLGTEPGKKAAEVFEELQLPGVTNTQQATHLARWHMAQLKLRPEIYSLNTDFEYLVCNRGDLVRVSHDVPLWGTSTGRVKSFNTSTKTIQLTEEVYLDSTKTYRILIRTNNITITPGSGSVYKTLQVASSGYYQTVTTVESIGAAEIAEDNLYMIGELNKETQELIVLSVETTTNTSARLTLVDYSPQIYTADLANDLLVFNPNITVPTTGILENTIVGFPQIQGVTSSLETSEQIAPGIYQTAALVTFINAQNLNKNAKQVQFELVRGDEPFNNVSPTAIYMTNKETGNFTFTGLITGLLYKLRARYADMIGSVFGPWSSETLFVAGTAGTIPNVPSIDIDLEVTTIVVKVPQTVVKPSDFLAYEFRLYKDAGTGDFWSTVPDGTNNIKVIQHQTEARFNLLDLPIPRLSQTGINYRIACRMVTRTNQYSLQSAVGSIVIRTIQ